MKIKIFLFVIFFSIRLCAQEGLQMNFCYNKVNKCIVLDISNMTTDSTFIVRSQHPAASDELTGTTIYVSETPIENTYYQPYKKQFPLVEYDSISGKSAEKCNFIIKLSPGEIKSFVIFLGGLTHLFDCKRLYTRVNLVIQSIIVNGISIKEGLFKEYDQNIIIE